VTLKCRYRLRSAERAAERAALIDPRIDAMCGAALALLSLKRTDETRTLGERALRLAKMRVAGAGRRFRSCTGH
jgi:hypothetical protein